MNKIIIIGVSHHNTLGMIRCVGLAGYRADLILIGNSNSYVTKSRYLNNIYCISDNKDIITVLEREYTNYEEKPIILTCTDKAESELDLQFNTLKNRFFFFNCGNDGLVTHFMNKQIQSSIAKDVGLTIPESFEYHNDLANYIYPCIIKPVESIHGGKLLAICNNDSEFKTRISQFDKDDIILIQQFIEKDSEIVVLGLAVNGKIIIPGFILKHREFNGGTLYSTVKSTESLDYTLIAKCKEMIKKMGYEGLFGIEFIHSKGIFYFIEVNLRNDATTYSLCSAGVNLPDLYIKLKNGRNVTGYSRVREIQSIVEFNDYKHRPQYNVHLSKWISQYLKSKCKYYYCLRDPLPFFYAPFK